MFRVPAKFFLVVSLLAQLVSASPNPPLGSTVHPGGVTFRVWAPYADSVAVVINNGTPVPMAKEPDHPGPGDTIWTADVPGAKAGDRFKYLIHCNAAAGQFIDPRCMELTGSSRTASSVIVDMGSRAPAPFTTPSLPSLVIYELHVGSFHIDDQKSGRFDFAGVAQQLDYLQKLGINAIELMPINQNAVGSPNALSDYDWGYDPSSYFAFKTSYGTPRDFLDLVNACHAHGIAVIVDVVFNHMSARTLLRNFGGYSTDEYPNGFYFDPAAKGATPWGPRPDFSRPQVAQFIEDNALMYLEQFGCDGERWDSVSNIRAYDGQGINKAGLGLLRKTIDDCRAVDAGKPSAKIFIAEDLRGYALVTQPTSQTGIGFNTQWDDNLGWDVRGAIRGPDATRKLDSLAKGIARKIGDDPFARVIYSENHDKVGHPPREIRIPKWIDPQDVQSPKTRRLSSLAAAIILTSPGVPMLFQGQEMLDPRTFTFGVNVPMQWTRVQTEANTIRLYHDLISIRRNLDGNTAGLEGDNVAVYHLDNTSHTIAYRRWDKAGPGDEVIVVANFSRDAIPALKIGFPRAGNWKVRFNSGSGTYDSNSQDAAPDEITTAPTGAEGLDASGTIPIGGYCLMILSQDRSASATQ
jgi:1,4-alpha-glucan branching enzyme